MHILIRVHLPVRRDCSYNGLLVPYAVLFTSRFEDIADQMSISDETAQPYLLIPIEIVH
jgi:hypothetical protein